MYNNNNKTKGNVNKLESSKNNLNWHWMFLRHLHIKVEWMNWNRLEICHLSCAFLALVGLAVWCSSSSGITTGQDWPASLNICWVSSAWPFSRIVLRMVWAAVLEPSITSSTPLVNVTVIWGWWSSVRLFTVIWQLGLDSLALIELHWARNSSADADLGSKALNSIFTFDKNFNIFADFPRFSKNEL